MKTVKFGGKPAVTKNMAIDNWVENREASPKEPTKRLTIEIPLELHKRIKSQCAIGELLMADVIRGLLEQRFPG